MLYVHVDLCPGWEQGFNRTPGPQPELCCRLWHLTVLIQQLAKYLNGAAHPQMADGSLFPQAPTKVIEQTEEPGTLYIAGQAVAACSQLWTRSHKTTLQCGITRIDTAFQLAAVQLLLLALLQHTSLRCWLCMLTA